MVNLAPFYEKYSKEKVDSAVELLTYRRVDPLPKDEDPNYSIMYVFRHGESKDNANFTFSGWRKSPITDKGKDQAMVLARKLKNKKIDMLVSSPQIRSVETMQIALSLNKSSQEIEMALDDRIKERSYGDLEGTSKLEMYLEDPKKLHNIRRSYKTRAKNGESIEDVVKRVKGFCDEIVPLMKEHKVNVAVSCHGNSIRGFRNYFENLTQKETSTIETPLGQDYAAYSIK